MTLPLEGVRIIDLSAIISGPMATQILADQGADVIKVEARGPATSCAIWVRKRTA
jgi:crotonobetainyl-CoA:carnitine CoA-transferase CaiB-like acyl-CoA transferase